LPIRYFVINAKTSTMHIYGCCQQTKVRNVPIRLFDTIEELETYAGRKLTLCENCRKKINERK
jgi:hypothetical protein